VTPHAQLRRSFSSGKSFFIINLLVLLVGLSITAFAWILINKPSWVGFIGRHTNLPQSRQWAAYDAMKRGNPSEARHLYEQGADEGNPADEYNLGLMEMNGVGGLRDRENGLRWIKKSADSGYPQAKQWMDRYNHREPY
jgi:hypothetical protein